MALRGVPRTGRDAVLLYDEGKWKLSRNEKRWPRAILTAIELR